MQQVCHFLSFSCIRVSSTGAFARAVTFLQSPDVNCFIDVLEFRAIAENGEILEAEVDAERFASGLGILRSRHVEDDGHVKAVSFL